jgi:hypothetical protein
MRRRLTAVGVATAVIVAGTGIVLAQSAGGGGQHGAGDATATGDLLGPGSAEVVVQTGGTPGGGTPGGTGSGGGGSDITCRLMAPTGQQGAVVLDIDVLTQQYEESGPVPAIQTCHDATGSMISSESILWAPAAGGGAPTLVDPAQLAEMAREGMSWPSPTVSTSPPLEQGTYAQLSTFFHVDNWEPVTSPPATAGGAWATVTGTPVSQSWVIQDTHRGSSETVTCPGAGSLYDQSRPYEAQVPPACGWTPTHSSDGQTHTNPQTEEPCFPATVTVDWDVSWTSNVVPGGPLGQGSSTTSVCLVVAELQATVVAYGG